MKDFKKGSKLVEDVNDRAWDGMCASIFSFFGCQHPFLVCRETWGAFFSGPFLRVSWDLLGVRGGWVGWRVKHCTAGIETKLFFFSFQLATNIIGRRRLFKGEGEKGGNLISKGRTTLENNTDTHILYIHNFFSFHNKSYLWWALVSFSFLSIVCVFKKIRGGRIPVGT